MVVVLVVPLARLVLLRRSEVTAGAKVIQVYTQAVQKGSNAISAALAIIFQLANGEVLHQSVLTPLVSQEKWQLHQTIAVRESVAVSTTRICVVRRLVSTLILLSDSWVLKAI